MSCQLKEIKTTLVDLIAEQMSDVENVNYVELGAAIDMVKDISEAMYYTALVKAMDNKQDESTAQAQ